uniref:Uncharacterized protein n=1 Tax=Rhizophora mucronata TaxID=61149 RepID=A0A2P2QQT7_RHIMU
MKMLTYYCEISFSSKDNNKLDFQFSLQYLVTLSTNFILMHQHVAISSTRHGTI